MCLRSFLKVRVVSTTIGIKALQFIGFQDLDRTKCLPVVLHGLGGGRVGVLDCGEGFPAVLTQEPSD